MVVRLIGFTFSQWAQPKESDNTTAEFKEEMREDREQLKTLGISEPILTER